MTYQDRPVVINTDSLTPPAPSGDMWENREAAYHIYDAPGVPKCSIVVLAYNRIVKTQYCVECILKYTGDVDYELVLIDNGSEDGTLEYFQSLPYEKKIVVKISKNIGAGYALILAKQIFQGKYFVLVPNDVYVTQNWLSNLLLCYESDPKIGFVVPVSSNVSNYQEVDISFSNYDDMQEKAAAFNKSDPLKWEERMRLINVISIFSRPILDGVGINDAAFAHDFLEDDLAARLRRSGYRLVLCGDTWVCHDHDFRNLEDKNAEAFQASLAGGRAIYKEKYRGIDAWDDVNNFELNLLSPLDTVPLNKGGLCVLAAEARCGTPVLEIRNRLRRRGICSVSSYAFTTRAKYYADLQTAAEFVACDRVDFIQSLYADETFDIVAFCEPVNIYPSPVTLLLRLYNLLKPGGVLAVKLRNTDGYDALLRCGGLGGRNDPDMPASFPPNEVSECLAGLGGRNIAISSEPERLNELDHKTIITLLKALNPNARDSDIKKLMVKNYIITALKG